MGKNSSLSPVLGWFIAGTGLLVVSLAMLASSLFGYQMRQQLLYTELELRLQNRNYLLALESTDQIFAPPTLLSFPLKSLTIFERERAKVALRELFEIISAVGQRKIDQAHRQFLLWHDQQLQPLLSNEPRSAGAAALAKPIEDGFEKLFELQQSQSRLYSREKELLQRRRTIIQRQRLIVAELRSLLGLEPDLDQNDYIPDQLYLTDPLKDLPMLKGLPENAESLDDLVSQLRPALTEEAENELVPPERPLGLAIKTLQSASRAISNEIRENQLLLDQTAAEITKTKENQRTIILNLHDFFCELILELARPVPIRYIKTLL